MSEEIAVLYTIGHSNYEAEQFLAILRQHQIALLVDVRSAPYSRYTPHFSKDRLEPYLTRNGIEYRFAGQYLGGRPDAPEVYINQAVPDEDTGREDFLKLVDYEAVMKLESYQRGISRLLDLVQVKNVVIMCSESNPHDCHRHHLIARSLIDERVKLANIPPITVKHILKTGELEEVNADVFGPTQLRFF